MWECDPVICFSQIFVLLWWVTSSESDWEGAGRGKGWWCEIHIHRGWFYSHPDKTTVVNVHVGHMNPFFLWLKMNIVNYLFIAFNFFLIFCNMPQRLFNYSSFPTDFFILFYFTKDREDFSLFFFLLSPFCQVSCAISLGNLTTLLFYPWGSCIENKSWLTVGKLWLTERNYKRT